MVSLGVAAIVDLPASVFLVDADGLPRCKGETLAERLTSRVSRRRQGHVRCRQRAAACSGRRYSPWRARALRIGRSPGRRVECCAGGAACLVAAQIDDVVAVWSCKFVKLLGTSQRCPAKVTVEIAHLWKGTVHSARRVRHPKKYLLGGAVLSNLRVSESQGEQSHASSPACRGHYGRPGRDAA